MAAKNKVEIRICGKDYSIVGTETDEYIQRVGLYIDKKMTEILKNNSQLSTSMASILTAVNVADDYLKTNEALEKTKKELNNAVNELHRVRTELSQVTEECDILKIKNTELQLELVRKQAENETMGSYVKRNEE